MSIGEQVTGILFLLNEVEIDLGKFTSPQLTHNSKVRIVESARHKIKAIKEELNELLKSEPVPAPADPDKDPDIDDDDYVDLDILDGADIDVNKLL